MNQKTDFKVGDLVSCYAYGRANGYGFYCGIIVSIYTRSNKSIGYNLRFFDSDASKFFSKDVNGDYPFGDLAGWDKIS